MPGKPLTYPYNQLWMLLTQGGHSIVKNMGGGWFNSLESGILVGKDILGFYKNIDLDNSYGVAKMVHIDN